MHVCEVEIPLPIVIDDVGIEIVFRSAAAKIATEQRRRMLEDQKQRRVKGLVEVPVDERLLAALANGRPSCAGVAVGIDRLVMIAAGASSIEEVLAFPVTRA